MFSHLGAMNRAILILFFLINICICAYLWLHWKALYSLEESLKNDEVFIPSKQWQPIGRDQPIPKGLHVRINLQTGEREAKLLEVEGESDDDRKNALMTVADETEEPMLQDDGAAKLKFDALRESLKNIKNEAVAEDGNDQDQVKKKFRTYEELKKELSEANMNIKTDVEILNDVFKEFNEKYKKTGKLCSQEEPELETIFANLETLLHQVDNAEEFSKQNGFSEMIVPCLSSNSTLMRTISARVLGGAVQNNPRVQISALQSGVISPLLKTIALTKNYEARASSISALSCLIRSFPFAEMKLFEEGGLDVLLALFEETSADSLKLQMKVVNLFYDLTMEKEDAEMTIKEEELLLNTTIDNETLMKEMQQMQEKLKQYKKVNLKSKLIERGWCTKLGHVLVTRIPDTNFALATNVQEDAVNHDVVDKVSRAMLPFAVECRQQFFAENKFAQILKNLHTYYERLISKDEFYQDIYDILQQLDKKMNLS